MGFQAHIYFYPPHTLCYLIFSLPYCERGHASLRSCRSSNNPIGKTQWLKIVGLLVCECRGEARAVAGGHLGERREGRGLQKAACLTYRKCRIDSSGIRARKSQVMRAYGEGTKCEIISIDPEAGLDTSGQFGTSLRERGGSWGLLGGKGRLWETKGGKFMNRNQRNC